MDGLHVPKRRGDEHLVGSHRLSQSEVSFHHVAPLEEHFASDAGERPELSGGVMIVPSITTKVFVPVPSHTLPSVLRKIASVAPRLVA